VAHGKASPDEARTSAKLDGEEGVRASPAHPGNRGRQFEFQLVLLSKLERAFWLFIVRFIRTTMKKLFAL